ncbi:MAG: helix-turn-helix transcriptional regulator [Clostridia bacterium]|nr:helix-turn-helix transcriptional regulator [Clostridia bacterium]
MEKFIITGFVSAFHLKEIKARQKVFKNRYASCFIVTVKGRIKFTCNSRTLFSDQSRCVFLPMGIDYTNECVCDAESYVFNFYTSEKYLHALELSPVSTHLAAACYENICKNASGSPQENMLVLSELYALAHRLFEKESVLSVHEKIVRSAQNFMLENYSKNSLCARDIADNCFISEIYLRKIFQKHLGTTPFKLLTEIRMKKARELAMEKIPVKLIARAVGYADVYQFSRAYKKYHGHNPSEAVMC